MVLPGRPHEPLLINGAAAKVPFRVLPSGGDQQAALCRHLSDLREEYTRTLPLQSRAGWEFFVLEGSALLPVDLEHIMRGPNTTLLLKRPDSYCSIRLSEIEGEFLWPAAWVDPCAQGAGGHKGGRGSSRVRDDGMLEPGMRRHYLLDGWLTTTRLAVAAEEEVPFLEERLLVASKALNWLRSMLDHSSHAIEKRIGAWR